MGTLTRRILSAGAAVALAAGLTITSGGAVMAADACGSAGWPVQRDSSATVISSAVAAVGSIPACQRVQARAYRYNPQTSAPVAVFGPQATSSTATNNVGVVTGGDAYRARYNNPSGVWSGWFAV